MLSISTGYDPKYLTGEVGKGVENYYTREVGRGEPAGIWQGRGTPPLGLFGEVDPADMDAVYTHFVDPRDPHFKGGPDEWAKATRLGRPPRKFATAAELFAAAAAREPDAEPERLEALRRQAERKARRPVAFIDLTFGVPKSFSILHTALRASEADAKRSDDRRAAQRWAAKADSLEKAIWAGNTAALEYVQEYAGFSRAGYHGVRAPTGGSVGRWIDAHGFVVASFFQHTNRNEDMHLHIHNAILNRVECADGKWRTLDSRAIHRLRGAAGAVAERVMTERVIKDLGVEVRWSEDGHTLELAGVSPLARALFSSRRREVTAAVKQLVHEFEQRRGRAPNALELSQLSLIASKGTRPRKQRTKEPWDVRLSRWERELRARVDQSLHDIAKNVPGKVDQPRSDPFEADKVINAAVAKVQSAKAAWTRYDLIRALNEHLPPCLGGLNEQQVVTLLHKLADRAVQTRPDGDVVCLAAPDLVAVPDELRLTDGRSVFEAPAEMVYATKGQLAAEEALTRAAQERLDAPGVPPQAVDAAITELAARGTELGADQAAAVRGLLTTTDRVSVLVGPAGTGKSYVMGMVSQLWEHHTGRVVLGLATAQRAALVLEDEGFNRTDNVDRWLQRQARLDAGLGGPDDDEARLRPGDLVVLDEAGMTPTDQLAAIEARCRSAGARLIVVGDERQLAAVGAGGAFRIMTQHGRTVYHLDEVRRFAHAWERDASLRLRDGDTAVLSDYERRGRIVDGGTAAEAADRAARSWLADTIAGRHSLLVVSTAEEAADLSARLRARLVELGRVSAHGVQLHHESAVGTVAGAGDIIQTRRNDWSLRDAAGRAVINRDMWQVTAVTEDGGLRVRRITGHQDGHQLLGPELDLPPTYVADHVTLGYAVTIHSAQGSTVDTCYPVVSRKTSTNALYVALTRGRLRNVAYVVTAATADTAPDKPGTSMTSEQEGARETAGQVLTAVLDRASPDLPATELQHALLVAAGSLPVLGSRWSEAITLSGETRFHGILADLNADGVLLGTDLDRLTRDEATGTLWRLLRQAELAGFDVRAVLRTAIGRRELGTAVSVAQVLHHRITHVHGDHLLPTGDTFAQRTPAGTDAISRYAHEVAEAMDRRCQMLGEQAALAPPQWAAVIGPVPEDAEERAEWVRRVGIVAGYRELYRVDHESDPIGPCPKPGLPEARAGWFAAWRALGEPGGLAAETTMGVADLVAAVDAYNKARAWAPDWVGAALRHDIQSGREHEHESHLLRAQAAVEPDAALRVQALAQADEHWTAAADLHASARDLLVVDEARAAWHVHTEPQRQAAARAAAELARRRLGPTGERLVTASKPAAGGKGAKRKRSKESVAYTGDINQALAKAQAARRRIASEQQVPPHQRQDVDTLDQARGL
ncbi:MobF family relaxase [Catellatospora sp. NPDC049133]|uniref:MobF family relaxase n=1 Tax=Catellatospora sp. NPDC049133 TaxID=3155499 RepID=UPI00340B8DD8